MGKVTVQDIHIQPLKKIELFGGGVLHGIKKSDKYYAGFGEAYFSQIDFGVIKAWKLHKKMKMNIVVPVGEVHFAFIDDFGGIRQETLGFNNYARLFVPPRIWLGFQGVSKTVSTLLNIANIEHSPEEVKHKELHMFKYDWEITN